MTEVKEKIQTLLQNKSYLLLVLDEYDVIQELEIRHDEAIPFFIVNIERIKLSLLRKIEQMSADE